MPFFGISGEQPPVWLASQSQ